MVRRPHPDPRMEKVFRTADEEMQQQSIRRLQHHFEETEDEKMKQWLRDGGAVLLIGAGTPDTFAERKYK